MAFVVTGATGQVGSAVIDHLLSQSVPVRAVIRSANKASGFTSRHVDVAIADLTDANALTKAFQGAKGVFAMSPPTYDQPDMHEAAAKVAQALATAITAARVPRVVVLSSVGAERSSGTGNIRTTYVLEEVLKGLAPQVVMVRCAWFMENWFSSVAAVKSGQSPVLGSMLQKLDRSIPQIATDDIGRIVAKYLTLPSDQVAAHHVVELEGPEPYSPNDVAKIVSQALGKEVPAAAMSEEMIRGLFGQFGWSKATINNWLEMVRGFDDGTIRWVEDGGATREKGKQTLANVLQKALN